jgi:hypothetical protein
MDLMVPMPAAEAMDSLALCRMYLAGVGSDLVYDSNGYVLVEKPLID